jgi:hypothetical protein
MKKIILIIGIVLIILNTLIGFMSSSYNESNIVLVDISLLISIGLIYGLFETKLADGFKIGLTVFFIITGFIRMLVALFSNEDVKDNFSIIILLVILTFEIICFVVSKYLTNK